MQRIGVEPACAFLQIAQTRRTMENTQIDTHIRPSVVPIPPDDSTPINIIKVSAHSRSTAVAGAIAGIVRERGRAHVQAIGAAAVNQATKAAAIARSYLAQDGLNVICIPSFVEIDIDDQERTALRLLVEPR
jgi:stage V sporulation protein S